MFLIEDDAKAVLYTGDIRSEPWWVSSLVRNPVILPYSHNHKRLDKLYLDTTFASKEKAFRSFPTKAAGLSELLDKVSKYPKETTFYFHAWTPGYEEVWVALSCALKSQIHIDDYKRRLYSSLLSGGRDATQTDEGSALLGFYCGNRLQPGCLTVDPAVRLHSCERELGCPVLNRSDTIFITPILSRSAEGDVMLEMGAGGGGGDLVQFHGLELNSMRDILDLTKFCSEKIEDDEVRARTLSFILDTVVSRKRTLSLDTLNMDVSKETFPLTELVYHLSDLVANDDNELDKNLPNHDYSKREGCSTGALGLPNKIQFPYSRHSSYEELCDLVGAFRPLDIYPCTFDDRTWSEDMNVQTLFGHLCTGTEFAYDREMRMMRCREERSKGKKVMFDSQCPTSSTSATTWSHIPQKKVSAYVSDCKSSPKPAKEFRCLPKRRRVSVNDNEIKCSKTEPKSPQLDDIRQPFRIKISKVERTPVDSKLKDEDKNKLRARIGENLSSEILEPPCDKVISVTNSECSSPETQISTSETVFASPVSAQQLHDRSGDPCQSRKEAYKAAKELNGAWQNECGLISSFDGNCEEEL
ncbi:hypothetical protein ACLMJK_008347 [Lecanora helva]